MNGSGATAAALRRHALRPAGPVATGPVTMYIAYMAAKVLTTIRLDAEDAKALARARRDGHTAAELLRRGLRLVAAKYYGKRRPPSTRLFVSTDAKLGDESELFGDLTR